MTYLNNYKWKYYNHAFIPTSAPHEEIDVLALSSKSMWNTEKRALFARWTTNFDCEYETDWWWVIKEAPYELDDLSSSSKKHIRQALKKCNVKKVVIEEEINDIWSVYEAAFKRYHMADNHLSKEQFYIAVKDMRELDCWAAYDVESGKMIGWMTCEIFEDCVKIVTAKYDPDKSNKRPSDIIHHTVCNYYLNCLGKKYITAGERSVNHITGSHEYKISTFQFRKAFCELNIKYRWWVKVVVDILYLFRRTLKRFDNIQLLRQIVILLEMEKIIRSKNEKN